MYALQVLAEALAGGPETGLHRSLECDKHASSVGVQYDADAMDQWTFSIFVSLSRGADATAVASVIELELQALGRALLTARHLQHAKEDLKTNVVFSGEGSMPAAARLAGEALVRGRTLEDVTRWPQRIDVVSAEQVQNARMLRAATTVHGLPLRADEHRRDLSQDTRRGRF